MHDLAALNCQARRDRPALGRHCGPGAAAPLTSAIALAMPVAPTRRRGGCHPWPAWRGGAGVPWCPVPRPARCPVRWPVRWPVPRPVRWPVPRRVPLRPVSPCRLPRWSRYHARL